MKICVASDLHGHLEDVAWPDGCEMLVIAGDIFPLNIQKDLEACKFWLIKTFFPWIQYKGYAQVILVAGNHDFYFQEREEEARFLMPENVAYLKDEEFVYKGYRFYGTPWIADLHRWAFYKDEDGLAEAYFRIPGDLDMLITHMPPKLGSYGQVKQENLFNTGTDYGSPILSWNLVRAQPRFHVFGHVHTGNHILRKVRKLDTWTANVSVLDEDYRVRYAPKVIFL